MEDVCTPGNTFLPHVKKEECMNFRGRYLNTGVNGKDMCDAGLNGEDMCDAGPIK